MIREPHPIDAILPTLTGVETIVEVGCHRMEDTAFLRSVFPNALIMAFEADRRNQDYINTHDLDRHLDVVFVPCAVGDVDGLREFHLSTNLLVGDDAWTRSSSLLKPTTLGDHELLRTKVVPCVFAPTPDVVGVVKLDTSCPQPDFIWCDAQGADDLVLKGATELLKRTKYLFIEHNTDGCYRNAATLDSIKALLPGWELLHCWPYDAFFRNPNAP